MITHHHVRRLLGHTIHCHTPYGTIRGVVIHCTKHHVFLAVHTNRAPFRSAPYFARQMPMGPGNPHGMGPGGGWQMAVPIAAILGITALGLHWW